MSTQLFPLASQARQRYANDVGSSVQLPTDAVKVSPSCAVPAMDGGAVFAGAATAAVTTAVCCEVAAEDAPVFVAVTTTRSV
jgi:hypothetical protein